MASKEQKQKHVDDELATAKRMNEQKIKLASEYLGMPGVPVKNRDNKSKTDGLKPVAKLEYESIRANPGDEVQAKTITDALTSVVRENIHALWAWVPGNTATSNRVWFDIEPECCGFHG
jgi:hypothetical protein